MKVVIQRVKKASVKVDNQIIGKIGQGFLLLVGVKEGDSENDAGRLAKKVLELRIMADKKDLMNKSIVDVKGEILIVPQFTLYADTSRGRRPSFVQAAKPEAAKRILKKFKEILENKGVKIEEGQFGARMEVSLINDGPVTIILES